MANQEEQPLWSATYLAPPLPAPAVVRPEITEDNFEIKGQFLHMVRELQFDGRLIHDPFRHVESFIEICDLFKNRGATDDAVRLRMFPFTLIGEAKDWLKAQPSGSFTTWELMKNAFISQYFPPAKADQLRIEINAFAQRVDESVTEAWDRYKSLLRACPTHNLSKDEQVKVFYRGITESSKNALDKSSGGIFMYNTATQAIKLLDDLTTHRRSWTMNPRATTRVASINNTGSSALEAQVCDLTKKLDLLTSSVLSLAGVEKPMVMDEEAKYLGNRAYQGGGGWNNNNNYQQRGNGPPGFNAYQNRQPHASNPGKLENLSVEALEDILKNHIQESTKITTELQRNFLKIEQNQRNQQASIQNVERDIGRIAQALSERPMGGLPSNTKPNPRNEQVNAIFTRSGIQVTPPHLEEVVEKKEEEKKEEETVEPLKDGESEEKEEKKEKKEEAKKNDSKPQEKIPPSKPGIYKPKIPFPQRLIQEKTKERYEKMANLIKQVHINVPLVDLIAGIPHYGKFFKDLVSNKNKVEEVKCTKLHEEASSIVMNMPPKLGDTGRFTIPCLINDLFACNALADLGASINLMPLSLYAKMGIGSLKATKMAIQLADRSVKYPLGIAENVPVRVDKFVFPVDFVVLEMEEDTKVPIILGRPFLNTANAVINVNEKKLSLGVGGEKVTFCVEKAMQGSAAFVDEDFEKVDMVEDCVEETFHFTPR